MALGITTIKKNIVGNQVEKIVDVTFDNSYPTGGESFTVNDVDKSFPTSSTFHFVSLVQNNATAAASRVAIYDYTNKKILLFTALGTEATNASDQSTIILRCGVRYGTGAV